MAKYVFGPVPSRRLGGSLGVNNIPPKYCSYSCVYCQLGRTINLVSERRSFYPWTEIVDEVVNTVKRLGESNIDYVTFVPDGEPTLDTFLGREISEIKKRVNIKIAVLTNASLLFREDVRNDLYEADLVSVKIDAATEDIFRRVNRPHPQITLRNVFSGIKEFSRNYRGKLITETMLVEGLNDDESNLRLISRFIAELNASKVYIAVPTRPPAESFVKKPSEETILRAYEVFSREISREKLELLIGYEGSEFGVIGDPVQSLLNIVSVHPMRIDYAREMLRRAGLDPERVIEELIGRNEIAIVSYDDHRFIVRRIRYKY